MKKKPSKPRRTKVSHDPPHEVQGNTPTKWEEPFQPEWGTFLAQSVGEEVRVHTPLCHTSVTPNESYGFSTEVIESSPTVPTWDPTHEEPEILGKELDTLIKSLENTLCATPEGLSPTRTGGGKRASTPTKPDEKEDKEDKEKLREELIKLSEDGEITQSVHNLRKASYKTIDKINAEYNRKRETEANRFLTDFIISKWADVLGGLDAIESSEELTKELSRDQLLRRDVLAVVELITPYVPFLGLLSGGITSAKHVYNHKSASEKPPTTDL